MRQPLYETLRPESLDDIYGQLHLVGKNCPLRRMAETGIITNMIFFGPPGTGKTTTANIMAKYTGRQFVKINATTASVSDIKNAVMSAGTLTAMSGILLYLDEIQYFSRKQQQSLLEVLENGKVMLIASTSENPYFYVYPALLSRCSSVFEFKPIPRDEAMRGLKDCIRRMNELGIKFSADNEVLSYVASCAAGDMRKMINDLDLLSMLGETADIETARAVLSRSVSAYNREDDHYDHMSALQKSIRGSDENAAVYYLAKMCDGGDLPAICRRLLVIASEDIGLAYPLAAVVTKACVDSALQLGFPEAVIPLSEAVVLLATAPKSNSSAEAIWAAMADVRAGVGGEIPDHLKDSHYKGAEKLGRGVEYKYPHSYKNHYIKQQYLPDDIRDKVYYKYGENKTEQAAKAYWDIIRGGSENKKQ